MVIVTDYELIENPAKGFFVRSEEQICCPCCNGRLKVIGSRKRICIDDKGEKISWSSADCDAKSAGAFIMNFLTNSFPTSSTSVKVLKQ